MITSGLVRQLLATSGVTDGQYGVNRQIWPVAAPQSSVYPRIVLAKISGQEETDQAGAINLGIARIQATAFARTHAGAAEAINNVITALNGLRNTALPNSVTLTACDMEEGSSAEFVDIPRDGREKPVYQYSCDFQVGYTTS